MMCVRDESIEMDLFFFQKIPSTCQKVVQWVIKKKKKKKKKIQVVVVGAIFFFTVVTANQSTINLFDSHAK